MLVTVRHGKDVVSSSTKAFMGTWFLVRVAIIIMNLLISKYMPEILHDTMLL